MERSCETLRGGEGIVQPCLRGAGNEMVKPSLRGEGE